MSLPCSYRRQTQMRTQTNDSTSCAYTCSTLPAMCSFWREKVYRHDWYRSCALAGTII
ncbi:hypothetical protein BDR07DRAFT_1427316 [Suillus spraguei]|nr:hypothetical protein BDR07DRAFT_1427316 [Suillus spraguei]